MCIGGSPSLPPPPPPVAPPAPPAPIVVAPPPMLPQMPSLKNEQARAINPTRKRRGNQRRGKAMLKIPLNTSGGGLNA